MSFDAGLGDTALTDRASLDLSDPPEVAASAPRYTSIGAPPWRLRCDLSSFTAPTDPAGYLRAAALFLARGVSPEHMVAAPLYTIEPGTPHGPPYADEPARFFERAGVAPRTVFRRDEVDTAGSLLALCVVYAADDAAHGRSADGPDLPLLERARFPLSAQHAFAIGPDVVGADREAIPDRSTGGGTTHLLLRWGQQVAFEHHDTFPAASEFRLTVLDAQGEGHRVTLPFLVLDAPR